MKNVLLIVNPRAGKAKAKTSLFDIVSILSEHDMRVTVEITRYSGHARDIAREIAGNYDTVACIGGDGTLNEASMALLSL